MGAEAPRVVVLLSDPGIPLWSSVKAGGVHARSMIRAFEAEGADVDVVALRLGKADAAPPGSLRIHEVPVGAVRRRWSRTFPDASRPSWAAGVEALMMQREFFRVARRAIGRGPEPALLYARHVWLPSALVKLAERMRAPMFLEVNALFAMEKAERGELAFPGLTRRLEGRALRAAARVLPVSEALARGAKAYGVTSGRIRVMPNGVDPERFDARLRERGGPGGDRPGGDRTFTIGLVSSFRPYHGVGTLLHAARLLQDQIGGVRLLLIGDGPDREAMARRARELGLEDAVEMPGGVPHEAVPAWLARCDAAVAPYEGELNQYNCPMKLYEYMAMKTPMVASAWGEIPRIVEDGRTGLLHEPGDAAALAAKLREVHDDPEAARRRAEAASEVARTHTWRAHARWILDDAASARRQGT